ncbi:MAG TPA: ShlB/FhaC/HecB family hemolysin secretion/activation protein [Rhodopila sp.]|uniref:ShlB/FhaC/HecB family hemolysin secretion/activation protein n=1 Tax=Rhodopila sp. TaxID=2480087 RepID=UPI002C2B78D7|nr:ShlB/FhaC/HecB family hemolysin secretion/activation protein [Rhodopila sp.]HVY16870.1 ShlB/FhaC/HecB family hemolysin secretion/activation protein [Rhodopila sp.]
MRSAASRNSTGAPPPPARSARQRSVRPAMAGGALPADMPLAALLAALLPALLPTHGALAQGAPPPQQNPVTTIAPPKGPTVAPGMKLPGEEGYPNQVPAIPVAVTSIVVEGVTTFPPSEINRLTQGLVGPNTPATAIEAARLAILRKYRDGGYPLVTVSASVNRTGVLRFVVVEGRISDVKLEGDIGPAGTKVLGFLHNLIQDGPSKTSVIERWLLLAQDVPGVTLQTVLRPSETEPGSLVLVARVSRTAISGFALADNRAYRDTGPVESLAVLGYNSLTSLGERSEVSIYKSLTNWTQIFGQADVEMFIGNSGLKFRVYGGSGTTDPSGTLATANYHGVTQVGGFAFSYPLLYSRREKLNLVGMFDLFDTSTTGAGIETHDSLRIIRFGADYARLDQVFGATHPAENRVSFRINRGFDGLGSTHTGQATLSRPGEVMDFTSLTGTISRNQTLFSPWRDSTVSLLMELSGQKSGDILPPEEQYHLGGLESVRGYYAGEVAGDSALATTLELQLNTTAHIDAFGLSHDVGLQFYTYYDWGESWQNRALDYATHVSSIGIGVRSALTRFLEYDMEGVTRLNRQPASSNAAVAPLDAQAFYWRVLVRF